MSENRHGHPQENAQTNQKWTHNTYVNHVTQGNQSEQSQCHVLVLNESNGVSQNAVGTGAGRAYTIVQLGQLFNLQVENQSKPTVAIHNDDNTDFPLNNQSVNDRYSENQAKFSYVNHLQSNYTTNTSNGDLHNQSETVKKVTDNQLTSNTTLFTKQPIVTFSSYTNRHPLKTTTHLTGAQLSGTATQNTGNWTRTSSTHYPENQSICSTTMYDCSQTVNTSTQYPGIQTVNATARFPCNQTVNTSAQYTGIQTVNTRTCFPGNQTVNTSTHYPGNQTVNTTSQFPGNQTVNTSTKYPGIQTVNTAAHFPGNQTVNTSTQYPGIQTVNTTAKFPGNQTVNTSTQYPGIQTVNTTSQFPGSQTVNTSTQYPGIQTVNTTSQFPGNQTVNTSTQYPGIQTANTTSQFPGNQTVNTSTQYPGIQTVNTTSQFPGNQTVNTSTQYPGIQTVNTTSQFPGNQTVNTSTQYPGNQSTINTTTENNGNQTFTTRPYSGNRSLNTSIQYLVNESHGDTSRFQENQSMSNRNIQQYNEQSSLIEQKGEESLSLLCSETFTSPTPPSDDCGWTQARSSAIWTHCENSSQGTAFRNLGKSLFNNAVKSHGPLSDEQFHTKIGKGDKGELLKAALLGETLQSDLKIDTELLKRDINSNFPNKCADDKLKFVGNDVDSGWRMSGSNGYDRNRMTGSSTGGTNNNISLLSDGSSTQSHTQPQVATAEGMLLGRIGGTGGVALHDIGSRSIVAGTAGAGPQVTLASVFRPPQSVPETGRYGTAFTTAAGSSAVGPYSPLYATGSHGAGIGPYSAFYSQYPGYSAGVMHGTLDPQYGSYSAVLQSMGSHAAQSQVPRSPYGGSGGTQATGVLSQYSLHMPRTTSPGNKTFIANTNIGTHERDDSKYRREVELDKRRYSTGVIKDEKPHHFSVPSGFPEPARVSFSSTLRESPNQGRDPQDYYKVPSGREGSLKHRILRPSDSTSSVPLGNPQHSAFTNTDEPFAKRTKSENLGADKDFNRHGFLTPESSQSGTEMSQGRTPHLHYPPHFMKGSIIQLGNGEYKRVEDLETDDFRHSADVSSDLKIDSSTVVHIEENEAQGTAVLGFVVGEHKIQVTVEATVEHPFFVFGQGWSSCEPAWTMKRYGLECHKLSVGDVCISLTHKEVTAHAAEISQQQKQQMLDDTYVFDKDKKMTESVQQTQRDSPGQGQGHRNRSPANSQSPTIQGHSYRSESGQYSESSTAPVKGEHLFGSAVSSQIPSSQTQEQRSLPSTTS